MPLRTRGGSIIYGSSHVKESDKIAVDSLLDQLEMVIDQIVQARSLKSAMVRSKLNCFTFVFLNSFKIYIVSAISGSISGSVYQYAIDKEFSLQDILYEGVWEYGLKDPFGFVFDRSMLDQSADDAARVDALTTVATEFVELEVQRVLAQQQLMVVSPLFGSTAHRVRGTSCFVVGPFADGPTEVYRTIIKPVVTDLGLVCHRADEIFSTRAIMEDIWKSICEARIVIADLSGRNPNVFYELGIAHTLGKDTILITQKDSERIPFDIQGIRQIRFTNDAPGGARLAEELRGTITSILNPNLIVQRGDESRVIS